MEPELTATIPEYIDLGESYINRKLRVNEMEATSSIIVAPPNSYATLPVRFQEVISFVDNNGENLNALTPEELAKTASTIGKPGNYRISTRIDFDKTPGASYTYLLRYYKSLDIASDLTNTVFDNHPDIYIYSALIQASLYMKNNSRVMEWKGMLDGLIHDANWNASRTKSTLKTDIINTGYYDISRG